MIVTFGIVSACSVAGLYLIARMVSLLDEINKRLAAIEANTRR
ncbi:MAG TPA: hypothetical protein VLX90_13165 [Steroidobacteraceae bacterium]|nr:hypothetical protein [Steroidobacteraceae bacterium]